MEAQNNTDIKPEAGRAKNPVQRFVMQNELSVADVLEPLNLSVEEKKELVTKVAVAVEKKMMEDAKRMMYGSEAPQKWPDLPPEKQGSCYGITICCA